MEQYTLQNETAIANEAYHYNVLGKDVFINRDMPYAGANCGFIWFNKGSYHLSS